MNASLFKWYGNADLDKMDLIEFDKALSVAIAGGMPKEIIDRIWKRRKDTGYMEMMRKARAMKNGV